MHYTWNEAKRRKTLTQRGLDFAHAPRVFESPTLTFEDDRWEYGEDRWVTLGLLNQKIVVLVHTEIDDVDVIRIISMREATKNEQQLYFSNL